MFANIRPQNTRCKDGDGNVFILDEHAERLWLPQRHAGGIKAMVARHHRVIPAWGSRFATPTLEPLELSDLERFVAGTDVFSRQSDGTSIAEQYGRHGIKLRHANMDRINGWAEVQQRLGDPPAGIPPTLFIHSRCRRLIETLPALQHDPNRPEDILKSDPDDDGNGGDDAADALRYLLATKPRTLVVRRLTGW